MMLKSLREMEPREKGIIIKVSGGKDIRRRLLDMGVVNGAEVEMQRVAPLGDPVEIRIKGYDLALRREEAANIQVEITRGMLSRVKAGETVTVIALGAGWGLQRRLADMGLTPEVRIKVISSGRPGQVVIEVRGSRMALGHGVAAKILVAYT
ncbi:MAG TPA: ferrous iron transport protein A [Dehalococcoidia bacterium]|nr:ferrous iron transport protein A [Dehalococcoidia bacterium]